MLSYKENRMSKQSIIAFLLLISFLSHFSHSYETPQVHQNWIVGQEFLQKNSVKSMFETCIAEAIPIATPFVALGKCFISWVKNRRNNKTKCDISNQPCTPVKRQEPVYYSIVKTDLPEKSIPLPCKKISKQLLNQLSSLRRIYRKYQKLHTTQSKRLLQRTRALKQSLNENLKCSSYKSNWFDIDPVFIQAFNLNSSTFDLNGIKFQHVLQKEFHDIAQETALAWVHHKNNAFIQQLVEKNIACIKSGIKQNQSEKIVEATRFADIGWAILDHIQALGKGACQGAGNTIQAFLHPIETAQDTVRGIAQCTYYLGQATLEAIDLSILAVTDQSAAHTKLETWKQNFTKLVDTMYKQWQVTPSHDITKFVSRFTTEILLTGKVFRALGGLFSFARINSTKLVAKAEKITKSISRATTPEGITTHVNKVVKHTQRTSKIGHTTNRSTAKLIKTGKSIKKLVEQRLQSRQSVKTENMSKQSVTALRRKRAGAIKERAQQKQFPPLIKTYEGSLSNNNLKPNIIKKFNNIENMEEHIFSKNHRRDGILNLGKNKDDIVDKFVNIVKLADHKNLLKIGPNQIHTIIKNRKVVIRAFIIKGKVLRINGFIETKVNNIGNVFELLVKEYRYG